MAKTKITIKTSDREQAWAIESAVNYFWGVTV